MGLTSLLVNPSDPATLYCAGDLSILSALSFHPKLQRAKHLINEIV
jgi:hypothetical protein